MQKVPWKLAACAAGAVAAGGGLFWTLPSDAQPPPTCRAQAAMTHTILPIGGSPVQVATPGFIQANIGTTFTTSDGRIGRNLVVTDLLTEGPVDGLGFVSIQFDRSRPVGPSSLIANQTGVMFPATQRMNVFITVDIDGQQFRSIDRVTLISTNVTSLPPVVGTVFELANQVRFEVVDKPGAVVLTMEPGKAAVIEGHNSAS